MTISQFQSNLAFEAEATIAVGQTKSNAIDLYGTSLVGFITDANLTGTALTFEGSDSLTGTYVPIHNNSGVISRTVATSKYYLESSVDTFKGLRFLKVVSGTLQATNPSVIKIVSRP